MQSKRTVSPMDREPSQTPSAGADGGTTAPPKPLGWCQRFSQWCVHPFVGRGQLRHL